MTCLARNNTRQHNTQHIETTISATSLGLKGSERRFSNGGSSPALGDDTRKPPPAGSPSRQSNHAAVSMRHENRIHGQPTASTTTARPADRHAAKSPAVSQVGKLPALNDESMHCCTLTANTRRRNTVWYSLTTTARPSRSVSTYSSVADSGSRPAVAIHQHNRRMIPLDSAVCRKSAYACVRHPGIITLT